MGALGRKLQGARAAVPGRRVCGHDDRVDVGAAAVRQEHHRVGVAAQRRHVQRGAAIELAPGREARCVDNRIALGKQEQGRASHLLRSLIERLLLLAQRHALCVFRGVICAVPASLSVFGLINGP